MTVPAQPPAKKPRIVSNALARLKKTGYFKQKQAHAPAADEETSFAPKDYPDELEDYFSRDLDLDDETFENFDPFTWWKEHTHPEVFRRGHAAYISTAAAPAAATAAPAAAEVDDQFKDAGFAPGDSGWRLLPIIALVVLAVDATSCQAERNFSSLSLTYDELRSSLDPENIEMLMFLKLNSVLIPEVARWRETEQAFKERQQKAAAAAATAAAKSSAAARGPRSGIIHGARNNLEATVATCHMTIDFLPPDSLPARLMTH
mmetsp:Transcript_9871/g.29027  ORF Transcript_9871/g.29027 Transcript_9871/m.29027 type:complete len:261 (-) Transcript_9871:89-871(-)